MFGFAGLHGTFKELDCFLKEFHVTAIEMFMTCSIDPTHGSPCKLAFGFRVRGFSMLLPKISPRISALLWCMLERGSKFVWLLI